MAKRGIIQMTLPASAFTQCSTSKWPNNTLFPDIDGSKIGYDALVKYLPLVLRLYSVSPIGTST